MSTKNTKDTNQMRNPTLLYFLNLPGLPDNDYLKPLCPALSRKWERGRERGQSHSGEACSGFLS